MRHQFIKMELRKLCRRLEEDKSSMWYDHVEELTKEYSELKSAYDKMQEKLDSSVLTFEARMKNNNSFLKQSSESDKKAFDEYY